jgi:hypothetical protein
VNTLRKQITPTWGGKFNAETCKEQTWEPNKWRPVKESFLPKEDLKISPVLDP